MDRYEIRIMSENINVSLQSISIFIKIWNTPKSNSSMHNNPVKVFSKVVFEIQLGLADLEEKTDY